MVSIRDLNLFTTRNQTETDATSPLPLRGHGILILLLHLDQLVVRSLYPQHPLHQRARRSKSIHSFLRSLQTGSKELGNRSLQAEVAGGFQESPWPVSLVESESTNAMERMNVQGARRKDWSAFGMIPVRRREGQLQEN